MCTPDGVYTAGLSLSCSLTPLNELPSNPSHETKPFPHFSSSYVMVYSTVPIIRQVSNHKCGYWPFLLSSLFGKLTVKRLQARSVGLATVHPHQGKVLTH